jgi:probable HAF family extracellular repeat protein
MKSKVLTRIVVSTSALLLTTASVLNAQTYSVVDLTALLGGSSVAKKINLNRQAVGHSGALYGEHTHAFVWASGNLQDLGTLTNGDYSSASDINKRGAVVGDSNTATNIRGFIWDTAGGMQDLGTLPGDSGSRAFGINDSDRVVGYSSGPHGIAAFIWNKNTGMTSLGVLPGGDTSEAIDINNAGSVVGFSTTGSGDKHAFLWTSANGLQDLGTLPAHQTSEAHKVNNSGNVIGSSTGPNGTHAFLWTAGGGMKNLGSLNGSFSNAFDVNDNGEVVGASSTAQGGHAFRWSAGAGMEDLNTLIPPNSGVVLTSATGINNLGIITAVGAVTTDHSEPIELDDTHQHAGPIHAFLLIPPS